ncbi:MAG: glycosyltransferase [Methanocalculus sp.]|nr:glycosyltransferase [Methanocalculus sp.]
MYPLSTLDEVNRIFIVRDTPGPHIDKVEYYCPPTWFLKVSPVAFVIKFLLMMFISFKYKPKLILGYLLFPHGVLAFTVGILTRTKTGVNLIAGPVDIFSIGSPIERFAYTRQLPGMTTYGRIMMSIMKRMDIIIANGSFTKLFLTKEGIQDKKIHILYKPMEIEFDQTNPSKEIEILFLGRLAKVKHVETVIRTAGYVKNEIPDIKVAIVGDGPEHANLVDLANSLNLSNTVTFYGWQDNPLEWINDSKISILTSEREGFPQTVMQSLYLGVPVVSSMCGDVMDIVKTGYNGILIQDHNDSKSFATSIIWLLQHPDDLEKYSENAVKSVKDRDLLSEAQNTWYTIIHGMKDTCANS